MQRQPGSNLDGPIDYEIADGFINLRTLVHVELDGSAQKQVRNGTEPDRVTRGTLGATTLDAVRDSVAAVHLPSLRPDYNCGDFACRSDAAVVTLAVAADGTTTQIRVDRGIEDEELPAGLARILGELDAIARQLP